MISLHQLRAPRKAQAAVEQAQLALSHRQFDQAEEHVARALAAYPNYSVALMIRAVMRLEAGDKERAAVNARAAIQADAAYAAPYILLASVYNSEERPEDALPLLRKALQLLPNAWQPHFEYARALAAKNDDAAALREMETTARLAAGKVAAPEQARIHYWHACVLAKLKDYPRARAEYEQVLKNDPESPFAAAARDALARLPALTAR